MPSEQSLPLSATPATQGGPTGGKRNASASRFGLLDLIRGITIISMVAFHLVYDLVYLYAVDLAWFRGPMEPVWQASIGWTFVFIAGCSALLSHSNGKRACKLGLVALVITVATAVASVDIPVYFGVIHCLALCTAIVCLAQAVLARLPWLPALIICLLCALATASVHLGTIAVAPGITFDLPDALYAYDELSFLGFPGPTFRSGDYFPLLPYLFVYLAGFYAMSGAVASDAARSALRANPLPAVAAIGRHSLAIYLIHQVVLLGCLFAIFGYL